MASYDFPLQENHALPPKATAANSGVCLPEALLVRNVFWFCRLRWFVIAALLAVGIVARFTDVFERIGLRTPRTWLFAVVAILTLGNVAFLGNIHFVRARAKPNGALINLWSQIVHDLLVLTVVVHMLGCTQTYVPFTYLFHIVLACVFFSRKQSLTVTLMACVFFGTCVFAHRLGIAPSAGIFSDVGPAQEASSPSHAPLLSFITAVVIWMTVWYLVSHLGRMIRRRDFELGRINSQLVEAREERVRHMLHTTHQLKAPFAAIHANTQILLRGHCGDLPEKAQDVLQRISARCRRLGNEIQEMLQLANLSAVGQQPQPVELDVAEVLQWCIGQVEPLALERKVTIEKSIESARTVGIDDHLKMLFMNVLANAVAYSHTGGYIRVRCGLEHPLTPVVTIADEGIGIPASKLSHIFNEHYRTNEAAQHNKESSGLGLSIVRRIAQMHKIRLRVESQHQAGTTFEIRFPPADEPPQARK